MLLSKELPQIGITCRCINEKEFDSLGLAGYNDGKNVCTFLAAAKYAAGLSSGISMIITSEKVFDELSNAGGLGDAYGICIVDNPRLTYFLLHNALCSSKEYCRPEFPTKIAESYTIKTAKSPIFPWVSDIISFKTGLSVSAFGSPVFARFPRLP